MPKEVINYPSYAPEHPLGLAISIHWSPLHVENAREDGPQLSVQFTVDALLEHLQTLKKHSPMDARSIVFTEPLSRDELQALIRAARRARDAAFGADE